MCFQRLHFPGISTEKVQPLTVQEIIRNPIPQVLGHFKTPPLSYKETQEFWNSGKADALPKVYLLP